LTIHPVYANIGMDQRMKNLTWLAETGDETDPATAQTVEE